MNETTEVHAGLYLHIPFCVKKCAYCDFYSITDLSLKNAFVNAIIREMELLDSPPFTIDTIYLGGGTPSVLSHGDIQKLLFHAFDLFDIQHDAEITIEVNPGTVDADSLKGLRQTGVNRLNIGVQSFSNVALTFLGRIHTAGEAASAIALARGAGFDNLGLDLIYGLPGQRPDAWKKDLEQAAGFSPEHLSCYTLTYEDGTPLGTLQADGRVAPLDDDAVAGLFKIMQRILEQHGYEHYEIANFARKTDRKGFSYRSRHNQKYWTSAPYIGLGPSAHSFTDPERRWNVADMHDYLARLEQGVLPMEENETLTREQRLTETLYLNLRTIEGIDIPLLEKTFDLDFHRRYGNRLEDLRREGLLQFTETRCALTRKGMRFLDGIAEMLVGQ